MVVMCPFIERILLIKIIAFVQPLSMLPISHKHIFYYKKLVITHKT